MTKFGSINGREGSFGHIWKSTPILVKKFFYGSNDRPSVFGCISKCKFDTVTTFLWETITTNVGTQALSTIVLYNQQRIKSLMTIFFQTKSKHESYFHDGPGREVRLFACKPTAPSNFPLYFFTTLHTLIVGVRVYSVMICREEHKFGSGRSAYVRNEWRT